MSIENMLDSLRTFHGELCALMRRGEMLWYGMASDYQSKYAFSADYDKAFKRGYHDQATACREVAEQLEALPLPSTAKEVAQFVASAKNAVKRCPQHPDMRELVERLVGEMDGIASLAGAIEEEIK
jgi:hypothetical protein